MFQAFHDNRIFSLLGFAAFLDSSENDLESPEGFRVIISESMVSGGIIASDLSIAFGVHPSTVSRWTSGKSVPQPLIRKVVIDWIRDKVNSAISSEKNLVRAVDNIDKIVRDKLRRVAASS